SWTRFTTSWRAPFVPLGEGAGASDGSHALTRSAISASRSRGSSAHPFRSRPTSRTGHAAQVFGPRNTHRRHSSICPPKRFLRDALSGYSPKDVTSPPLDLLIPVVINRRLVLLR